MLIVHEVIHSKDKGRKESMIVMLDISKVMFVVLLLGRLCDNFSIDVSDHTL